MKRSSPLGIIKRRIPKLHDYLVKLNASPAAHWMRRAPTIPLSNWQMRRNHPYLLVDLSDKMGLGALLSLSVRVLDHAERRGLQPIIRFTNPLYSPNGRSDTDWLPLLFNRRGDYDERRFPKSRFVRPYWHIERRMSDAHGEIANRRRRELFLDHVKIADDVIAEVDAFCADQQIGSETLAIHYRGTDKYLEAPRVHIGRMIDLVAEHADRYSSIFVATDEPEFLMEMREHFPHKKVRDLNCKWIYPNSQPAHLTPGNGAEKAREALLTMLVLSRCGLCIRTPSNLSEWAQVFNPDLPTILLQ